MLTGTATAPASSDFGIAAALIDLNGDGYADAVVGADDVDSGAGAAYVFTSTGSGGVASASYADAQVTLAGALSSSLGNSID